MPRRFSTAAVIAVGVPLFLSACSGPSTPRAVLLVTIDTCRADRFGCYGGHVRTPALDGLAADGTLFLQALAPTPLTLPSHLSLLTGLYPDRHSVRDNGAGPLPDEAVTLAEVLQDEGWSTAAFLAAVPLHSSFGGDQGFDLYDDHFLEDDDSENVMSRMYSDERTAQAVTDVSLEWLGDAERDGSPWFAWVHYFDPHVPYAPPAEFAETYGPSSYDGEVAYVDRQLARLLDSVGDDVLVVVVADHAESLGEHGENTHSLFVYEAALRVPWVIRGPGIPAGRRLETPVSTVRVMPTILDLLDVDVPADLDESSVAPLLEAGGSAKDAPQTPIFAEALFPRFTFGWSGSRSIRRGNWKLIESPEPELYDLAEDPHELNDVIEAYPEVAEQLLAELHEHAARGGALAAGSAAIDPEMRQRLQGLGYLGSGGRQEADEDLWDFDRRNPRDMIPVYRQIHRMPQVVLSGARDEADALIDSLRTRDPGNVEILTRIARIRRKAGHLQAAVDVCREILDIVPDDVETWKMLVTVQVEMEDRAGAIESVRRELQLAPTDTSGRLLLASLLQETGQERQALKEYDRVLELLPASSEAVRGKASILSRAGREFEAAQVLRDHLPELSDDVDVLNNLAWILVNEDINPKEGLEYARRARALTPDDPAVLDTLGWAAVRAGVPDEALDPLRRALEATGDAEVRAHLGIALLQAGRSEPAEVHLREAVRQRPELERIPEVARWKRESR